MVLASTSPYRAALLARLRIPFEAVAPTYVETNDPRSVAATLVLTQAEGKARSVVPSRPGAVVIGSDQVAVLDGEILTKPGSPERAIEQLGRLSGRTHRLLTAVVTLDGSTGERQTHLDETELTLRSLSPDEIVAYVAADTPEHCAGSYKIESLGISLFERQRGDDPTAIVGLPLIALSHQLRNIGFRIP